MKPFYTNGEKPDGKYLDPVDAATVILVRDRDEGGYEIFLERRAMKQDFMGGAYVFPGGKVEEGDCEAELLECSKGFDVAEAKLRLNEPEISDELAMAVYFAALRETFEEAGVLLARSDNGKILDFTHKEVADRLTACRTDVHDKKCTLCELARRENIEFAPELMVPYSHWITPEIEAKRFDTRFMLAKMPWGQEPVHCSIEMTKSVWRTPDEALREHFEGAIVLMPPTLKTIEELAEFGSSSELLDFAASREISPILPQAFMMDGGFGVKLPHDPEYTIEGYKLPPRIDEPSRIVLLDGKWRTTHAPTEIENDG